MTNEPLPPATCALGAEALPADPVDIPAASSPSQAHTHSYGQGLVVKRSRVPARETRSRTIARFNGGPSGDLLRARHAGPARTLATTDSAASARGQPQRRDWQADGPCRPEAVTLSMSTVLSHATTSGQREPRERRRRQMPAPTRRQGSRRSIQETPYSPDSRIAGMPNERAGSTAAACSGHQSATRQQARSSRPRPLAVRRSDSS